MGLRNRLYWILGFVFLLVATGCSNEADPEEPVVLGVPPDTAYLGVEYAYNFGAYGGDDILDFTLVNAPPWMGFEDTANKARTGVILRGVPGITGGRRGEEDLGNYNRISVNATDGSRLGGNYFNVTVEHNVLAVLDADFTEGESYLPEAAREALERAKEDDFDPEEDSACVLPDVSQPGTYTVRDVRVYDGPGNDSFTTRDREYQTHPAVVAVTLAHPSVEPVTVAFEFSSLFSCNAGSDPKDCEYTSTNQDDAKPLEDYVTESGSLPPPPDYLQYISENEGILTFEPGKTTCFIRLEVIDDKLPELAEGFRLELTEVREGLASLTGSGGDEGNKADDSAALTIQDNEPTASFEPGRMIVTEGADARSVTVRLNKKNETGAPIKVDIKRDAEESTASEADYELEGAGGETGKAVTVEIPHGAIETTFLVRALNNATDLDDVPEENEENKTEQVDDILTLVSDVEAQFGRENYARAGDASVEVVISEWTDTLDLSAVMDDFIPTALVSGTYGELYVAGVMTNADAGSDQLGDESGNQVAAFMFDRFGQVDPDNMGIIYVNSGSIRASTPGIAFTSRLDEQANPQLLTRNLAIGYTITEGALGGEAAEGGDDIGVSYLQRKAPHVTENSFDPVWEAQLGSGAADQLVDIATSSTLGVIFGANTFGNWPLSDRQSYRGDQDTVLGQLTTNPSFGKENDVCGELYCFEWARMIGTTAADRLAAAPISGGGAVFANGETTGALEAGKTLGGSELFYVRTDTGNLNFITQQYGTERDDTISDAAYIGTTIWTTGSNTVPYEVVPGGVVASDTLPKSSRNPYVLIFTASEAAVASITLPDEGDISDEHIHAIDGLDDYAVIGGDTNGSFQKGVSTVSQRSAILASVRLKEEEPEEQDEDQEGEDEEEESLVQEMQEDWRYQMGGSGPTRVVDLALSNNGKVFALIEEGAGYRVILLDDRGKRMDQ